MSRANIAMGVDIGGTHITAALVDLQNNAILPASFARVAVNAAGTADEIIQAWSVCMKATKQNTEIDSICMAMPGPFDYEFGISQMRGQDKYENLYQLNLKELLAKSLNLSEQIIFMDNDAACFLQGEVFKGAVSMHDKGTVIGVTLGTGLGSAVYKHGKSKSADMWCWPFKDGIAEDYLCTRWFVKRWHELTGETINGVKEITALSRTNEQVTIIFNEFGDHLAAFLSDFITNESPEAIVIGGNIAKAFDWFSPTLTAMIGLTYPAIKIKPALLGEEAPLLGAVSSWLQSKNHFAHISN